MSVMMPFPIEMQAEREERAGLRQINSVAECMIRAGVTWDEAHQLFKVCYASEALDLARQNQCRAARMIGVHRNTLRRMLGDDAK